jgi:hypothetical protein
MRFLHWVGIGPFVTVTVCHSVSARQQTHGGSELATICQINRGPKAGTSFDFQPYGVMPLPVGPRAPIFKAAMGWRGHPEIYLNRRGSDQC